MSRLKHPISSLKEPFGKAGLTVAILALVLALVGGAYAAGGLTKSQEKQVTKIAKKYAGKPGATGPAGAAGTNGTNGKDGANGTNGSPGGAGKSVTVTEIETGEAECEERGGAMVEEEGAGPGTEVCNGAEGSPWTAGGVLPPEQTETGSWAISEPAASPALASISFNVQLKEPLDFEHAFYVTKEEWKRENGHEPPAACSGNPAVPTAKAGNLCVYETKTVNLDLATLNVIDPSTFGVGAATSGAALVVNKVVVEVEPGVFEEPKPNFGVGTWAVTAAP